MALAELQAALARLSTDPAARALLLGNPQAFAEEASLSPEDLATLTATADGSLHLFARSLLHKRSHEAGRAVPQTRAALGEAFGTTFEAYAATHPVARDPAQDAQSFLRWLGRSARFGPALRDLALYELGWLQMRRSDRRLLVGLYRSATPPRRFLAVWWRLRRGQPCRYFQWPPGPSPRA